MGECRCHTDWTDALDHLRDRIRHPVSRVRALTNGHREFLA
ncbi:hypothetical protein NKJ02_24215 [Mesorhizobium sp. M0213]